MIRRNWLNLILLVSIVASLALGGGGVALAQNANPPNGSSPKIEQQATMQQALQGPLPPNVKGNGQMRSMTEAQRLSARLAQAPQQRWVSKTYAGINPATAALSPLATQAMAAKAVAAQSPAAKKTLPKSLTALQAGPANLAAMSAPLAAPDYFGFGNYANSPLPTIDPTTGAITGGMHKFVDTLAPLCPAVNDLGQCLPVAVPDTATFPGSDYYEIELGQYSQRMHADLPAAGTLLRGYRQVNVAAGNPASAFHNLGPIILAMKDRPVRVKFINSLPTGAGGDLFIPTDTTYMGAGMGYNQATLTYDTYTQNRATLHLHGGNTPWISDGTPHQWTAPTGETATTLKKGVSVAYVPDMWYDAAGAVIPSCAGLLTCATSGASNNPGDGKLTFYWTNQETGRLMFYHDHAYGITRLNVYAGEAAGYLLSDPAQETALRTATVPGTIPSVATADLAHLLPLVIQDKTFVPDNGAPGGQLAAQDPTWDVARYGGLGNLWFPHVYTPNQNPADVTGANAFGRWDYGPWFWPPQNPATLVSQPVPCTSRAYGVNPPAFPPLMCPGTPNPSGTPESFMDTPIINGTAYPSLTVDPAAYRLQILSAGNDRTWNLGLYVADPLSVAVTNGGSGYMAAPAVTVTPPNGWVLASTVSSGVITSIQITAVGSGYTAAPNVTISGDGTGATATATIDVTTGTVTGIKVTNVGKGYTFAVVTIAPPAGCTTGCVTATAATTPTPSGSVLGVSIVTAGTAFTTAPVVTIAAPTLPGGTTATATTTLSPTAVRSITVSNRGAGYLLTKPPTVTIAAPPCTINGTTCILATATAQAVLGKVYISLGVAGAGYTSVPAVTIAAPPAGGTQATATATLLPTSVGSITVTNTGSGYTAAPVVTIGPPPCTINGTTCILATATAQAVSGNVSISLGFAGVGYTSAPAVSIAAPSAGGTQASVTASINTEVKMVDAVPHSAASALKACAAPTATGGAGLAMASVVNGVPLNNTGLPANCYPSSWPTDGRDGGVPDPLSAGPPIIQIGTEGGLLPAPAVIPSTPVTYEYNRRSITVLNIFTHGLTMGPAERADVVVDFSKFAGKTLILYNDAPAPVPAFDSRVDYYTGDEDQTLDGGAPSTLPGYGPNTRTLMQIKVNATGTANNFNLATLQAAMPSIFATTQDPIIVPEPAYPAANGGAANPSYLRIQDNFLTSTWLPGGNPIALTLQNGGAGYTSAPAVTIAAPSLPGGITAAATTTLGSAAVGTINVTNSGAGYLSAPTVTIAVPSSCTINGLTCVQATAVATAATPLLPKTIQELFTLDYGRMNATLGVELPFTNFLTQTTIPYGYTDPPTEIFKDGETQLWKITHNGVDTHFIHFHLFTVQVINRVGWDGAIKPPDPNELSWKDTVRMNPLEDIIVALKPMKQVQKATTDLDVSNLPNSIRPLDVTQPVGASLPNEFTNVDPANQGATVTNDLTNFGWEYVWHCHILGHEENDMMRPMILAVPPKVPGAPTASPATGTGVVNLTWSDNSANETGFTIQRATVTGGVTGAFANVGLPVGQNVAAFNDTPPTGATYVYRVIANNLVGYTKAYVAPAVGYPTVSADSAPSAPSNSITR